MNGPEELFGKMNDLLRDYDETMEQVRGAAHEDDNPEVWKPKVSKLADDFAQRVLDAFEQNTAMAAAATLAIQSVHATLRREGRTVDQAIAGQAWAW